MLGLSFVSLACHLCWLVVHPSIQRCFLLLSKVGVHHINSDHTVSLSGFGQGIRRSTFSLAAILGPLWAGGSGTKGDLFSNYYVWLAVPCGLLLFSLVSRFRPHNVHTLSCILAGSGGSVHLKTEGTKRKSDSGCKKLTSIFF